MTSQKGMPQICIEFYVLCLTSTFYRNTAKHFIPYITRIFTYFFKIPMR